MFGSLEVFKYFWGGGFKVLGFECKRDEAESITTLGIFDLLCIIWVITRDLEQCRNRVND